MLRWCAYCQRFLGEQSPYDDLSITHGVCDSCRPTAYDHSGSDFPHIESLRIVLLRAFAAGRSNDFQAIEQILEEAARANIRLVDILLGIIGPALHDIGEQWHRGTITIADQQRFSAFCEAVFGQIAAKVKALRPTVSMPAGNIDALLMNAPGNSHTLAIRILALWLLDRGANARIVDSSLGVADLAALVGMAKPRYLLISVALPEQIAGVMPIVEQVGQLPSRVRPKIYIGGNAVKLGLVSATPGTELIFDINALSPDLWSSRSREIITAATPASTSIEQVARMAEICGFIRARSAIDAGNAQEAIELLDQVEWLEALLSEIRRRQIN